MTSRLATPTALPLAAMPRPQRETVVGPYHQRYLLPAALMIGHQTLWRASLQKQEAAMP